MADGTEGGSIPIAKIGLDMSEMQQGIADMSKSVAILAKAISKNFDESGNAVARTAQQTAQSVQKVSDAQRASAQAFQESIHKYNMGQESVDKLIQAHREYLRVLRSEGASHKEVWAVEEQIYRLEQKAIGDVRAQFEAQERAAMLAGQAAKKAADEASRAQAKAASEMAAAIEKQAKDAARVAKEQAKSMGILAFSDAARNMEEAFGGMRNVVLGLGRDVIKTASDFQILERRFETLYHSASKASEMMQYVKKQAIATPFNVKELTEAAVTIKSYSQDVQLLLPKVSNAAAAMGRDVNDIARGIGMALAGSAEGFEILRNQLGINNQRLKEYGATVSANGELQRASTKDMEKARTALINLLNVEFAGGSEKRMGTLAGAVSNFQDALTNLSDRIGKDYLPQLTELVKGGTKVVDSMGNMSKFSQHLAVDLGVTIIGIGALGQALAGLGRFFQPVMAFFQAPIWAQAVTRTGVLTAATNGLSAAWAAAISPMGLFVAAASAIYLVGTKIISNMEEESKRVEELGNKYEEIAESIRVVNRELKRLHENFSQPIEFKGLDDLKKRVQDMDGVVERIKSARKKLLETQMEETQPMGVNPDWANNLLKPFAELNRFVVGESKSLIKGFTTDWQSALAVLADPTGVLGIRKIQYEVAQVTEEAAKRMGGHLKRAQEDFEGAASSGKALVSEIARAETLMEELKKHSKDISLIEDQVSLGLLTREKAIARLTEMQQKAKDAANIYARTMPKGIESDEVKAAQKENLELQKKIRDLKTQQFELDAKAIERSGRSTQQQIAFYKQQAAANKDNVDIQEKAIEKIQALEIQSFEERFASLKDLYEKKKSANEMSDAEEIAYLTNAIQRIKTYKTENARLLAEDRDLKKKVDDELQYYEVKLGKARVDAAKATTKTQKEEYKDQEQAAVNYYKRAHAESDGNLTKQIAAIKKILAEYKLSVDDRIKWETKLYEVQQDLKQKRLEAEKKMAAEIYKLTHTGHEAALKDLEEQVKEFEKFGYTRVEIEKWVAAQTAEIRKAQQREAQAMGLETRRIETQNNAFAQDEFTARRETAKVEREAELEATRQEAQDKHWTMAQWRARDTAIKQKCSNEEKQIGIDQRKFEHELRVKLADADEETRNRLWGLYKQGNKEQYDTELQQYEAKKALKDKAEQGSMNQFAYQRKRLEDAKKVHLEETGDELATDVWYAAEKKKIDEAQWDFEKDLLLKTVGMTKEQSAEVWQYYLEGETRKMNKLLEAAALEKKIGDDLMKRKEGGLAYELKMLDEEYQRNAAVTKDLTLLNAKYWQDREDLLHKYAVEEKKLALEAMDQTKDRFKIAREQENIEYEERLRSNPEKAEAIEKAHAKKMEDIKREEFESERDFKEKLWRQTHSDAEAKLMDMAKEVYAMRQAGRTEVEIRQWVTNEKKKLMDEELAKKKELAGFGGPMSAAEAFKSMNDFMASSGKGKGATPDVSVEDIMSGRVGAKGKDSFSMYMPPDAKKPAAAQAAAQRPPGMGFGAMPNLAAAQAAAQQATSVTNTIGDVNIIIEGQKVSGPKKMSPALQKSILDLQKQISVDFKPPMGGAGGANFDNFISPAFGPLS